MKKFEKARLDVVELNSQDVIATSSVCGRANNSIKEQAQMQFACTEQFVPCYSQCPIE